ncbi:YncE family protein [Enterobacter kobei]|uniref:YncE family protein n=1 Tax=Enterobacter kobei TaxID=208224 RepID=UPI003CE825C7
MPKIFGPSYLPSSFFAQGLPNFASAEVQGAFYIAGGGVNQSPPSADIAIVNVQFQPPQLKPLIHKVYDDNHTIGSLCCSKTGVVMFCGSYPNDPGSYSFKARITYAPILGGQFGDEVEIELPDDIADGTAFFGGVFNERTKQVYFAATMNYDRNSRKAYVVIDAVRNVYVKTFESPSDNGESGVLPVADANGIVYLADGLDDHIFRYDGVAGDYVDPIIYAGLGIVSGLTVDDDAGVLYAASTVADITVIHAFDLNTRARLYALPPVSGECVSLNIGESGKSLFCLCKDSSEGLLGISVFDLSARAVRGGYQLPVPSYADGLGSMRWNKGKNCLLATFATLDGQAGYFVVNNPEDV